MLQIVNMSFNNTDINQEMPQSRLNSMNQEMPQSRLNSINQEML